MRQRFMARTKPLRVVLLAYDDMNLLDLSGPLQALSTANRLAEAGEPVRYETIVASVHGGNVMTSARSLDLRRGHLGN